MRRCCWLCFATIVPWAWLLWFPVLAVVLAAAVVWWVWLLCDRLPMVRGFGNASGVSCAGSMLCWFPAFPCRSRCSCDSSAHSQAVNDCRFGGLAVVLVGLLVLFGAVLVCFHSVSCGQCGLRGLGIPPDADHDRPHNQPSKNLQKTDCKLKRSIQWD